MKIPLPFIPSRALLKTVFIGAIVLAVFVFIFHMFTYIAEFISQFGIAVLIIAFLAVPCGVIYFLGKRYNIK